MMRPRLWVISVIMAGISFLFGTVACAVPSLSHDLNLVVAAICFLLLDMTYRAHIPFPRNHPLWTVPIIVLAAPVLLSGTVAYAVPWLRHDLTFMAVSFLLMVVMYCATNFYVRHYAPEEDQILTVLYPFVVILASSLGASMLRDALLGY